MWEGSGREACPYPDRFALRPDGRAVVSRRRREGRSPRSVSPRRHSPPHPVPLVLVQPRDSRHVAQPVKARGAVLSLRDCPPQPPALAPLTGCASRLSQSRDDELRGTAAASAGAAVSAKPERRDSESWGPVSGMAKTGSSDVVESERSNQWTDRWTAPEKPDTYEVRLFTGVIRNAYWTGSTWIDNAACKKDGRLRSNRQLLKMIRAWRVRDAA